MDFIIWIPLKLCYLEELRLNLGLKFEKYESWHVNWHQNWELDINMDIGSFKILLWLFVWIDCFDLEVQRKGKAQIPKWIVD